MDKKYHDLARLLLKTAETADQVDGVNSPQEVDAVKEETPTSPDIQGYTRKNTENIDAKPAKFLQRAFSPSVLEAHERANTDVLNRVFSKYPAAAEANQEVAKRYLKNMGSENTEVGSVVLHPSSLTLKDKVRGTLGDEVNQDTGPR